MTNTKVRWDTKDREFDPKTGEEDTQQEAPKTMKQRIIDQEHRELYAPINHALDHRKVRSSVIKANPRLRLLKPRTVIEVAEQTTRSALFENETISYLGKAET